MTQNTTSYKSEKYANDVKPKARVRWSMDRTNWEVSANVEEQTPSHQILAKNFKFMHSKWKWPRKTEHHEQVSTNSPDC